MDGVREQNKGSLATLHVEIMHLTKLVDDLHELARADAGAISFYKEPIDLVEIIDDTLAAFAARLASHSLDVQFARTGRIMVFADPDRLRQLFANLLENSLRYTHSGGTLKINWAVTGSYATVSIEDSAPGVREEALPLLFERFFRADDSRQRANGGSGLGLAICKSIVSAHEGTIVARASDLGGLSILITLPVLEEPA